jgi:hypothetical protein
MPVGIGRIAKTSTVAMTPMRSVRWNHVTLLQLGMSGRFDVIGDPPESGVDK